MDMPPDPPNSLIYSVFLALAAAGPLQCERLEPPVKQSIMYTIGKVICYLTFQKCLISDILDQGLMQL